MLANQEAIVTIAVKDLEAARTFYEETLELKLTPEQEEGTVAYSTGKSTMFVYESQYAGTNKATAVTWIVGREIENIVNGLENKGVTFEHYDDLPETTRKGPLHFSGSITIAWFKDPDGNIHSLVSG